MKLEIANRKQNYLSIPTTFSYRPCRIIRSQKGGVDKNRGVVVDFNENDEDEYCSNEVFLNKPHHIFLQ